MHSEYDLCSLLRVDYPDPVTKKKIEEGKQKHAFNEVIYPHKFVVTHNLYFSQYVSSLISVQRSLPDQRDPWCKTEEAVLPLDKLPETSIIICFHNEAWSTLLRTVHSVLDRSPMSLVLQIILGRDVCQFLFLLNCFSVDDSSTFEYLHADLDHYMSQFDKVEILRLSSRQGLIRARLEGVNHAKAPVLTFLDSHCECLHGWLEPLLSRIRRNSSSVVCPAIDAISEETFKYNFQLHAPVGGFDWNMRFNWHAVPGHEVGDTFCRLLN